MGPQVKSKERIANHGEVFTAKSEVDAMLDLVKQETERIDSRFLEPACGNGNFLAEILKRKLAVVKSRYGKNASDYERYAVIAATSIYGVEILSDNIEECRERMFVIWNTEYTGACGKDANDECREAVRYIFRKNMLCGDALTLRQDDGTPIIFAEWAAVNGCLIKRRDFQLADMLSHDPDVPNFLTADEVNEGWALKPVREFPPIHYRRVQDNE
jgi:hypothetical protein